MPVVGIPVSELCGGDPDPQRRRHLHFAHTNQDKFVFSAGGQLLKEVDRNGYATTLAYTNGQLSGVTDPAGRSLTLRYE
jgi:YD repeat-containing protein